MHAGGGAQRGARKIRDHHLDPAIEGREELVADSSRVAEVDLRRQPHDLLRAVSQTALICHDRPLSDAKSCWPARNGSAMISSERAKIIAATRTTDDNTSRQPATVG